ncbi:17842_t:CDS:2 [Funneliformis geosporum]|uniref:17842_t:CDS:1 n=1 Tax=Funneliformis geosporum TaxID=1117311 RepID=A0A9W4WHP2_9GLOM|nr:17842_t:CDS:2 [Funneliformis geosporum]
MNYITPQALKFQLDNFQKILIAKRRSSILTTIKTETTKLLQDLPRGVDKNQLLTLLEGIFGSKNFQDGKYKGGKEVVLETVQEFFGKENFKNDQQNLKQSLTNGEAKTLTSQLIEEKLGGSEKFQEGVYQSEAETINIVKKGLANEGPLLEVIHDIFGPDKFFPKEGGEGIPKDKFGSNVEGAEDLYEDAKSKGQQILGEDFNDTEKRRIEKEGHTPDIIQTILKDIPIQRKKLAPESLINKDKIIATYTTKTIVKSKEYEKSTKNINPLKHIAEEVDNAHDFIIQKIDLETDLNNFPTDEEIKGTYNEKQVPDTINYEELRNLRNSKIKSLFKQYFQGNSPSSLKDNEIELWRTSPTGLPNTGKDQRLAFDNGWITPREITETKTKYEGIENIAVLKVKKVDIDNEILKVKELVKQINAYRYLRDLDANQANIDKQFAELKTDLLPPNKAQEIKEAEQKQREKLFYYLTDPKDGGIEETTLKRLEKNLENK